MARAKSGGTDQRRSGASRPWRAGTARDDAEIAARRSLKDFAAKIPQRMEAALDTCLPQATLYAIEGATGIARQTLATWLPSGRVKRVGKGQRRRSATTLSASIPSLAQAAALTTALGGISLDWLAGHDDVPMWRGARAVIGVFHDAMRDLIVSHLSDCLETTPEFVTAAGLPKGPSLVEWLMARAEEDFGPTIEQKAHWKLRQVSPSGPWVMSGLISEEIGRERVRRQLKAVESLPDPILPEERRSPRQQAKAAAYRATRIANEGVSPSWGRRVKAD